MYRNRFGMPSAPRDPGVHEYGGTPSAVTFGEVSRISNPIKPLINPRKMVFVHHCQPVDGTIFHHHAQLHVSFGDKDDPRSEGWADLSNLSMRCQIHQFLLQLSILKCGQSAEISGKSMIW